MNDIRFYDGDEMFSYRVAGICVHDGMVLLQKTLEDDGYAFPGGHVEFGETHEETLKREFMEEIGAEISVKELKWVAEIFFPHGKYRCTQICLYYMIEIESKDVPMTGHFKAVEDRNTELIYYWIPIEEAKEMLIYPKNCRELLSRLDEGIQHFIYKEE